MVPYFSIIMASFNYAPYIGAAIESVISQSFQSWELLIVDDCSEDASWQVISKYKDDRIQAWRNPRNLGACPTYNQALHRARGQYICCLDADDFFFPGKLQQQADFFAAHPDIDVCGTFVTEVDQGGLPSAAGGSYADWFNVPGDLNDPASWVWENRLCHSGTAVRATRHHEVGDFDPLLVYTPDWQFWIRVMLAGGRFAVIQEPLVGYRNHGGNITHRNRQGTIREYAGICAQLLFPRLRQMGRDDLVRKASAEFIRRMAEEGSTELGETVARQLFGERDAAEIAAGWIEAAVKREAERRQNARYLEELQQGKNWLEDQWRSSADELAKLQASAEAQHNADVARIEVLQAKVEAQAIALERIRGNRLVNLLRKIGAIDNV